MKNKDDHINFEKKFFENNDIIYSRSKAEVWSDMEKLLEEDSNTLVKVNFSKYLRYGIAAVLIITLGLTAFFRFYTEDIYCPNGQHKTINLPDGSKVTLNANSILSYRPFWWEFKRELNFSGEAFFEVKKGKKFEVISEKATTTVLGTSFNIYSRGDTYKVHCITGKVKVERKNQESTTLVKNEYCIINKENKTVKLKDENKNQISTSWIKNEFEFTKVPLKEVYEEVERQFDIIIEGKQEFNELVVTGFKRGSSVEEILNIIGKPSGITFKKISKNKYLVTK